MKALLLLWLGGVALRLTILAVPPVIPLIHDDLHLSETQVGILSGIPMVLFAAAAIAGSLMVARLGAVHALLTGLALCAVGSVIRGVGPHIAMLYFGTVVTAFGVAVMQPSLPPLVRAWVPQRMGFATAVYTNGLLVGEILPAALTIPLVLPMLHRSWQWSFVFWAVPVALIAFVIFALAPRPETPTNGATPRNWMPDFRNGLIWRIGLLLGSVNATYFALNGFLPDYLTHTGQADLIHAALTANNVGQLPASFMLLISAERLVRTPWSYIICALINAVGLLMITLMSGAWVIVGAGLLGCFAAAVLVLILALPPLISPPDEVHRVSAGMFTISYSVAVIVPIISGALWDYTGWLLAPFIPMGVSMAVVIGLAPTIVLRDKSAGA
ncbi:MFS transporter [Rhodoplanes sp. Z2-YC6860]|uniref:MFS transporter n=1 Tax=Rhodoplanes sp. Z2-YC6860 TaxID=674703 RepID=UPI0009FF1DDE|nr:MFS transporter [Rhodoplanes sp. Z2-YC6860]